MDVSMCHKAASQYGSGEPVILPFGGGLINYSYRVTYPDGNEILLQCINQATFSKPENIIRNYVLISEHLSALEKPVPALIKTKKNKLFWVDELDNFWRATSFITNSYTESKASSEADVSRASKCFAEFSTALSGLDPDKLEIIITGFHDLRMRYNQFEQAITEAGIERLLKATHVIASLRERYSLVELYDIISADPARFPLRIMHHDCKISNILFDASTHEVICPVDLDTVMPGKFFSDIGDMIRTMACTRDENSTEWEHIDIVPGYYKAVIDGYRAGAGDALTEDEARHLHDAGKMLIYMQALRFVTDFLLHDTYYKTSYPEQNLNRALNQLILLEKLEEGRSLGRFAV